MTYDAGGYGPAGPPPPGAYPPPGYPAYPSPGFGRPPHWQSPGYLPGPAGPGQPQFYGPPVIKPGVVPLRPLGLSDIFNGAVSYVRANPKATLGLTTIVVVIAQILSLLMSLWPLTFTGDFAESLGSEELPAEVVIGWLGSTMAGGIATALATTVLSGMLTVVIGRSVFGASIGIGEAWSRLRPRLWALIGFTVLKTLVLVLLFAVAGAIVVGAAVMFDGLVAFVIGAPLILATVAAALWLSVMLTFAPVLIVLERRDIVTAVTRSFALIRGDFWRVFGIWLLAYIVAQFIAGALAVPFSIGGQVAMTLSTTDAAFVLSLVLFAIGGAVGQIITAPFAAGVSALQYTDRRMRAEAFDLVLQTGAAAGPHAPASSTDDLWLAR